MIPLEEEARARLKGNILTSQSPSFASPRVRARSVGDLNIRETTTEYGDASLTSTLLATGEDDALTVSRHGGGNRLTHVHENFKDLDFQFSPFLGEMDGRLKSMLNLQPTVQQQHDHQTLLPKPNGNMIRQVSDPLTSGNNNSLLPQSLGGTTSSINTLRNSELFPNTNHHQQDKSSSSGILDKLQHSFNKMVKKAREVTDLFTTGPVTRAGSTGFVTFNSLTAATSACQLTLSHKSFNLQV